MIAPSHRIALRIKEINPCEIFNTMPGTLLGSLITVIGKLILILVSSVWENYNKFEKPNIKNN